MRGGSRERLRSGGRRGRTPRAAAGGVAELGPAWDELAGSGMLGGPGRLLHRCNTCYVDSLLANDIADIAARAVHALS